MLRCFKSHEIVSNFGGCLPSRLIATIFVITIICITLATYVRHRYARHSLYCFF